MMNDDYILWRLYVPIIMIIILVIMIYFHRRHVVKYLYFINIFFYLVAIFSYFILIDSLTGKNSFKQWMNAVPFIWMIGIFAGYFLSLVSVSAFIAEHAQRHIWARVTIGIIGLIFFVLCIIGGYLLFQGILSLKSG